ncbi:MAG TPA: acyl carrier protein [Terriglobia bacterium]|nr:acyl carrier protein [Terriglobia bacterium]
MDKAEILKRMNDIFVEVLDDTQIVLSEATTADDVDGWDSLTHVQLVLAVEQHFKIRFTAREIRGWSNVGEMIACVISKQQ